MTPVFHREHLKNRLLTFSDDSIEGVLTTLSRRGNFTFDKANELTTGIDVHQDFVNAKSREILGDCFEIGDGIFILSSDEKVRMRLLKAERDLIRPYYTTNELFRYFANRQNSFWIIYTDSSFKNPRALTPFPNIKKHLDKFRSVITSDNHPYGLHRSRKGYFFTGEKIVSARKCSEPTFSYTDFDCYVSQTFNVIKSTRVNLKYLTAILNSTVVAFWLKHRGKMQGHQFQINIEPLLGIPIVLGNEKQQESIAALVDKILAAMNRDPEANTYALEREIDELVYGLYGLTPDEIKLVEGAAK